MSTITVIITYAQRNKVYNIEIDVNSQVQELISEFAQMLQINNNEKIILSYQGRVLDAKKTFKDQMVQKGTQIELRVETQGGQ